MRHKGAALEEGYITCRKSMHEIERLTLLSLPEPKPLAKYWCKAPISACVMQVDGVRCDYRLTPPLARVGAHEDSEIRLVAPGVPNRGYYLHRTDDGIYFVDLLREHVSGWMTNDTRLVLAGNVITLSDELKETPDRADLRMEGSAGEDAPTLHIKMPDGTGIVTYKLSRSLTIVGRRRPSNIGLSSRTVSAVHCAIYWDRSAKALWAIDLLSREGTFLNGERISICQIRSNDQLVVGKYEISYSLTLKDRLRVVSAEVDSNEIYIGDDKKELTIAQFFGQDHAGNEFLPEEDSEGAMSAIGLPLPIANAPDTSAENFMRTDAMAAEKISGSSRDSQINSPHPIDGSGSISVFGGNGHPLHRHLAPRQNGRDLEGEAASQSDSELHLVFATQQQNQLLEELRHTREMIADLGQQVATLRTAIYSNHASSHSISSPLADDLPVSDDLDLHRIQMQEFLDALTQAKIAKTSTDSLCEQLDQIQNKREIVHQQQLQEFRSELLDKIDLLHQMQKKLDLRLDGKAAWIQSVTNALAEEVDRREALESNIAGMLSRFPNGETPPDSERTPIQLPEKPAEIVSEKIELTALAASTASATVSNLAPLPAPRVAPLTTMHSPSVAPAHELALPKPAEWSWAPRHAMTSIPANDNYACLVERVVASHERGMFARRVKKAAFATMVVVTCASMTYFGWEPIRQLFGW